ncbi:hypothetical protein CKAH01_03502, partial [Colletotrichum kahawae]
ARELGGWDLLTRVPTSVLYTTWPDGADVHLGHKRSAASDHFFPTPGLLLACPVLAALWFLPYYRLPADTDSTRPFWSKREAVVEKIACLEEQAMVDEERLDRPVHYRPKEPRNTGIRTPCGGQGEHHLVLSPSTSKFVATPQLFARCRKLFISEAFRVSISLGVQHERFKQDLLPRQRSIRQLSSSSYAQPSNQTKRCPSKRYHHATATATTQSLPQRPTTTATTPHTTHRRHPAVPAPNLQPVPYLYRSETSDGAACDLGTAVSLC